MHGYGGYKAGVQIKFHGNRSYELETGHINGRFRLTRSGNGYLLCGQDGKLCIGAGRSGSDGSSGLYYYNRGQNNTVFSIRKTRTGYNICHGRRCLKGENGSNDASNIKLYYNGATTWNIQGINSSSNKTNSHSNYRRNNNNYRRNNNSNYRNNNNNSNYRNNNNNSNYRRNNNYRNNNYRNNY